MGIETVAWEGSVGVDAYRIVQDEDGYGAFVWSVECYEDGEWVPVSYGPEADPPEVAAVAAHLAREAKTLRRRVAELEKRLRRLVVCARTSGGTAGPDAGLMQACTEAEDLLSHPTQTPEGEETRDE